MISMTISFDTGGCGRPWACLWYSWLVISPKTDWVVSKTVHEQNRYFWIFNEYRILAYPNHIQDHIFCYIFEEHTLGMSEVFVDSHISQNWLSSVQNCMANFVPRIAAERKNGNLLYLKNQILPLRRTRRIRVLAQFCPRDSLTERSRSFSR